MSNGCSTLPRCYKYVYCAKIVGLTSRAVSFLKTHRAGIHSAALQRPKKDPDTYTIAAVDLLNPCHLPRDSLQPAILSSPLLSALLYSTLLYIFKPEALNRSLPPQVRGALRFPGAIEDLPVAPQEPGAQAEQLHLAVSINYGSFLWVSLSYEPYFF